MPETSSSEKDRELRLNRARKFLRSAFETSREFDVEDDPQVRFLRSSCALALRELNGGE